MKLRIEKEVSIASAFTHLIAAWDYSAPSWYRRARYTETGDRCVDNDAEPLSDREALAYISMEDPDDESVRIEVKVTGKWIAATLRKCIKLGGYPAKQALAIINDSTACDQDTADVVMQVGAYGSVVFG